MFGCIVAGYLLARGISLFLGNLTPQIIGAGEAEMAANISGLLFAMGCYVFFYKRRLEAIESKKESSE